MSYAYFEYMNLLSDLPDIPRVEPIDAPVRIICPGCLKSDCECEPMTCKNCGYHKHAHGYISGMCPVMTPGTTTCTITGVVSFFEPKPICPGCLSSQCTCRLDVAPLSETIPDISTQCAEGECEQCPCDRDGRFRLEMGLPREARCECVCHEPYDETMDRIDDIITGRRPE